MSSISKNVTLYAQAKTTWSLVMRKRDKTTKLPIPLTGLRARGQVRNAAGTVLLTMGDEHLVVDAPNGTVTLTVASTETAAFIASNARTELVHGFELFDASTPAVVTPLIDGPLIVQPAALL